MRFGSGLDISRTPANSSLLGERDDIVAKYNAQCPEKEHKIPEPHLLVSHSAFAEFQKIAGPSSWRTVDLDFLNIEATRRPNAYHRLKRQGGEIPVSSLERCGRIGRGENSKPPQGYPRYLPDLRWLMA